MRDPVDGILTRRGRVVYDRKKDSFTWTDVRRIIMNLDAPTTIKQSASFLWTLVRMQFFLITWLYASYNRFKKDLAQPIRQVLYDLGKVVDAILSQVVFDFLPDWLKPEPEPIEEPLEM